MNSKNSVEEQAQEWSVTLSSGDADQHTLEEFRQWREASPEHEHVFQKTDRVWQGMGSLEELRAYAILPSSKATQVVTKKALISTHSLSIWLSQLFRQPYSLMGASAFVFLLAFGLISLEYTHQNSVNAPLVEVRYQTMHGELKSVELKDGSQVTLAPESMILVQYDDKSRNIHLLEGEALFNVTKNPQRPFVVLTGKTETRVLGTTFTVKRSLRNMTVAVKEGKVQVSSLSNTESKLALTPGQSISSTLKGELNNLNTIDTDSIGSWAKGRLIYEDASLKEVIADANRYYPGKIILGSVETGELRLAISFNTDNINQMLDSLAQLLPITINKDRPGTVILTKD